MQQKRGKQSTMETEVTVFRNLNDLAISVVIATMSLPFCYGLSLFLGHVEPVITYISDTVTEQPVSGVFGLSMTLMMFLVGIAGFIRHIYVKQIFNMYPKTFSKKIHRVNTISGWYLVGTVISFLTVGNFEVSTAPIIHGIAGVMSMTCGVTYGLLQIKCSKRMVPTFLSPAMYKWRQILAVFSCTLYVTILLTGVVSMMQFDGAEMHRWKPENKGYFAHAVSSVSEWILLLFFSVYIATYAHEFKSISLNVKLVVPNAPLTLDLGSTNSNNSLNGRQNVQGTASKRTSAKRD